MAEKDQGWSSSDRFVCAECISEPGLQEIVLDALASPECDFCDRVSADEMIAASFDRVMEAVGETVHQYFERAEEILPYDGESESGFFGTTYATDELFYTLDAPSEDEEVMAAVVESLGRNVWCDRHPFSTTGVERYEYSWQSFCATVKHDTRFFFGTHSIVDNDEIAVAEMLKVIVDVLEEAQVMLEIPAGKRFCRTRCDKRTVFHTTWQALGSPPKDRAPANRMSAAGISVFYASTEMETARAEVLANLREVPKSDDAKDTVTSAEWTTLRPLVCVDLTRLPPVPSPYAAGREHHDRMVFLASFVESITQPVAHDGREHIDYVPTQILTEYVRHEYRTMTQQTVDCIAYPSAQRAGGKNFVIFAAPEHLDPNARQGPLLVLDESSLQRWTRDGKEEPTNA